MQRRRGPPDENSTKEPARGEKKREERKTPFTIVAAITANGVITAAKFVVAMLSGSAAMLSEGVHSAIDTANQGLMVVGARRSRSPADRKHPFGYGKELYFWSLVYAGLLFAVGCGISVYEGITSLLHPELPTSFWPSYVVLAIAFLAEGVSWSIAVRAVNNEEKGNSFFEKLFRSKDPARYVVVGEDSAAMVGVLIAAAGLGLAQITRRAEFDAIASLAIAGLLGTTAIYLMMKTRELLVGRAADEELRSSIEAAVKSRHGVWETGEPFTMHMGPDSILVGVDVTFDEELSTNEVARAVDDIEECIRGLDDRIERIFVEPQLVPAHIEEPGEEVRQP